jgi:hypothetical protein
MQRRDLFAALIAALSLAIPAHGQRTQAPAAVDYDTFMQQDVEGRIRTFNRITPENRAALVRTQIERWLAKNRDRLTAEQRAVMNENLAFVTTERYAQKMSPEEAARARALETRTAALFSREDMMQALTIRASHIPRS